MQRKIPLTPYQLAYIDACVHSESPREALIHAGIAKKRVTVQLKAYGQHKRVLAEIQRLTAIKKKEREDVKRGDIIENAKFLYRQSIEQGDYKQALKVNQQLATIGGHFSNSTIPSTNGKVPSINLRVVLEEARGRIEAFKSAQVVDVAHSEGEGESQNKSEKVPSGEALPTGPSGVPDRGAGEI